MINLNPFVEENVFWSNILDDTYLSNKTFFVEEFSNPTWYNSGQWKFEIGDASYFSRILDKENNYYVETIRKRSCLVNSRDANNFLLELRMKFRNPKKLTSPLMYLDFFADDDYQIGYTFSVELSKNKQPYEMKVNLYSFYNQVYLRFIKRGSSKKINCDVMDWFIVRIEANYSNNRLLTEFKVNNVSLLSYSGRQDITSHGRVGLWLSSDYIAVDSISIGDL